MWTGAWTGDRRKPSAMRALVALTRGVCAGKACAADERASFNPLVQGPTPWRPTSSDLYGNNVKGT